MYTICFGILFILKSISFSFAFVLTFICIASSDLIALRKMSLKQKKKIYIITRALNKRRKPAVTGYNKIHLNHPEGLESRQSSTRCSQPKQRASSIIEINRHGDCGNKNWRKTSHNIQVMKKNFC